MKPIEFKHQNVVFAKDQPEYQPLPALRLDTPEGQVISCWKLTFRERLTILFTGKLWVSLMSFNKPLTPSFFSVNRRDVYTHPDDKTPFWKRVSLILALFLVVSCTPKLVAIYPQGRIMEKEQDRVLVAFPNRHGDAMSWTWVDNTRPDTLTQDHYYELVLKKRF